MKYTGKIHDGSLLTLRDLDAADIHQLLDSASSLKKRKRSGKTGRSLQGKSVALIFEKMSTRTRCATAVACADECGHTEYLGAGEIHLGEKESVIDTARVLGRFFDGVMFRGYRQETVRRLAQYSGVPVWNGLTDEWHPTQALADLLTVREEFGGLDGVKIVYIGDGRNNVANSLTVACAKCGLELVNCCPEELQPSESFRLEMEKLADSSGGVFSVIHDPAMAVDGANVIYTDVWVSMGEEAKKKERMKLLEPYAVNMDLIGKTGNADEGNVIFLHCLPAFHNSETAVSKDTGAMEVSDEVFESSFSRVFDQAENRLHTIKAIIVSAIGVL